MSMESFPECYCDFCKKEAVVYGRVLKDTSHWRCMCWECFQKHGLGIGPGKGHELMIELTTEPESDAAP